MAAHELFFINDQLGNFNSSGFTGGFFGSQNLTVNAHHPGERLVTSGAISDIDQITGWRLTVEGDEEPGDNDVVPGAPLTIEYSTDGGTTWLSYSVEIGQPDAVWSVRQDEEGWMAITANIPGQPDGQMGFIVADDGVARGDVFTTDETVLESQVGEYALPCFASGTLIDTDRGPVLIQDLNIGDLVATQDAGFQPIRWIGSYNVTAEELEIMPKLRPIRIRAGALGNGTPSADLIVSPQHRVLVRSKIGQRMFGAMEVLVAAKQLVLLEGIDVDTDLAEVEYFHFIFDDHQLVVSNGAETESLYAGPMALQAVGTDVLEELYTIFPQLRDRDPDERPESARQLLSGRQGRKLAHRHALHDRPLIA